MMAGNNRRTFLKQSAALAAVWPGLIARSLALPANRRIGSIMDVEHVVILMQENRSFDHYFGTLNGVRGYSDPRPAPLPSGQSVLHQPDQKSGGTISPFRLDTGTSSAQWLKSLDHSWKGSQAAWKNHDNWIAAKGPMTMGYFERSDIPFYHALADAFTICDAYHCSIFSSTNPNRLFLFTGTSGLGAGYDGPQVITNPKHDEDNHTADPANDPPQFKSLTWTTYAERLGAAGIDWRLYQEHDNYADNPLAYFANFRGLDPSADNYRRARSWPAASTGKTDSHGDYLVQAFAADVAAGTLPQVSWLVAPQPACEHPEACPGIGQSFTARLLSVLTAHPEVWAKTVFLLMYDENDGFFDHVPPPVPAISPQMGKSGVSVAGEIYHGEPVGLGPRVPMLVISPWSKGGYVNSQLFDHTSVIRFLEKRFGVMEPNITPWRRAVCGDLTSAFDFSLPGGSASHKLPDTKGYADAALRQRDLPAPTVRQEPLPRQAHGRRPARALPYDLTVRGDVQDGMFNLALLNRGAGAALTVYAPGGQGPWFYTVDRGQNLEDRIAVTNQYRFDVHGPNGSVHGFEDTAPFTALTAESRYDAATQELVLTIRNTGDRLREFTVQPILYAPAVARHHRLSPGESLSDRWPIAASDHWYDIELRSGDFRRRWAGHMETGQPSRSDPALAS
jgi:phospholipase C